jgi:predicted dehydrogenase
VTAQVQNEPDDPRFKTVEASMAYTMKFPSGVLASCTTTYASNTAGRFRVMGEQGQIVMEPAFGYGGLQLTLLRGRGPEPQDIPQTDHFATEMDEFSRCILENKPTRTPGEEGLKDMKVIEALYRAAGEGKSAKV